MYVPSFATIGSLYVTDDLSINGNTYIMSQYVTETLSVSGQSQLTDVSVTALTVSGQSWLSDVSVTALTVSGQTQLSDASVTALSVSGQSQLTDVSASQLSVTGAVYGGFINEGGSRLLPPGVILPYSVSAAPVGFLLCDGSAYSRTTYSALFDVIGVTYGSPNVSSFNVPDLRQRMPYYGSSIGTSGGSSSVTLSVDNLPSHSHSGTTSDSGSHSHSITDPGHTHISKIARDDNNGSNVTGQAPAGDSYENVNDGMATSSSTTGISINSVGNHSHTYTTSSVGSGTSFSVLNPYLSLSFIIKY